MLNSVGKRTPPCGMPVLNVVRMCDSYICADFASLDVLCDELNVCAWNVCL